MSCAIVSCRIDRIPNYPHHSQIARKHPPITFNPLTQEMSDKIDK